MITYFITRHPGALQWAKQKKLHYDVHVEHLLSLSLLNKGDTVVGTLPINLVYQINQKGVIYVHLSLEIPPALRGVELTAEQLDNCKATLERYEVIKK
ncbi:CRISPR-associated protein Csx16 [Oceanisphaera profunda]|uniref:CRISPR-associated protein Csx16 n=1 Tax=Oceanisphaera profunda TaxID=1416627 RepID=A0A1Y0D8J3_9GAMM|nr:CRISPR-associated protein Csx16 [Oceanisphaera profunda]ART83436.1 CRISPR-associated protein Csx16 [Oceanisphaera profunda]